MMIKNTSYGLCYKTLVPKTSVVTMDKRHITKRHITRSYIDMPIIATTSKVIANTITYPIESIRLLTLCKESLRIKQLYRGILSYIPYCITSSYVTYTLFFHCLNSFKCADVGINVLLASLTTSFLTSFYKLPYNFYQKNKIINGCSESMKSLYNKNIYPRAVLFMLSEDVPELLMRFYFNNIILANLPQMDPLAASLILAIITSLIVFPMEFWKTSTLCNRKKMTLSLKSVALLISTNVLNLFLFFGLLNSLSSSLMDI